MPFAITTDRAYVLSGYTFTKNHMYIPWDKRCSNKEPYTVLLQENGGVKFKTKRIH